MLIQADARSLPLRDGCIDCVVTSPPYFGLRDYGVCTQIGLESTVSGYVDSICSVFYEIRRVLKLSGVAWLNLGDSYAGVGAQWGGTNSKESGRRAERMFRRGDPNNDRNGQQANRNGLMRVDGCKPKDLIGVPWRVAFALQADGWYLRSDIIWSKPNPMPESVTDRPTKAHEYLFLLSKSERYFYDAQAIAEDLADSSWGRYQHCVDTNEQFIPTHHKNQAGIQSPMEVLTRSAAGVLARGNRNKRTVWTIPTMPYSGAHFATMPEKLVEPCILAGCPMGGLVLDPFSGSGTVLAVAERLGRRGVGVDLNPAYHELAKVRTAQRGLRFGTDESELEAR